MAIVFDFEAGKGFHFASAFAKHFNVSAAGDRVMLPEELGHGSIQEVYLDNGLSLCLHDYTLRQELILRRHGTAATEILTIKFDGRRLPSRIGDLAEQSLFAGQKGCVVEFGTSNFFSELTIPPNERINFLVVVGTRTLLLNMLQSSTDCGAIADTIRQNPSFFLYEAMSVEMEQALKRISLINDSVKIPLFLYHIRVQELIYLLFVRLLSRKMQMSPPVGQEDIKKIHRVRAKILADLSVPPHLPDLAREAGLSLTKMKRVFRQTFGDSIYNYYQSERMRHAAHLLKEYSVSEVGYHIGFSNLSHFTRVFERHHQIKPKRYKASIAIYP